MPPRSVLLNVSITSKVLDKDMTVESVKEVTAQTEQQHGNLESITPAIEEGKHERADSAVSVPPSPSFTNIAKPSTNTIAINTACDTAKPIPNCAICESTARLDGSALQHCSRCKSIYYCSKDCQKVDWSTHKRACVPSNTSSRAVSTAPSPSSPSPNSTIEMLTAAGSPSDARNAADQDEVMQDV